MSSISYDFILIVVIFELVFAFSIGIVCILFSCSLYRAIKDSESVEDLQDVNLSDHISRSSDHHTDDDYESAVESIFHHFETNSYGSMSYGNNSNSNSNSSNANTDTAVISPAYYSSHIQMNDKSPNIVKEKTPSTTSTPFKSLSFPDDFSYTHITQNDSTKLDEYIIDEKLSELDLERRLDAISPFVLAATTL